MLYTVTSIYFAAYHVLVYTLLSVINKILIFSSHACNFKLPFGVVRMLRKHNLMTIRRYIFL
jgi:hypothetical protein